MSEQTTTMKEQLHELLAEQGDKLSYADAKKEIGDRLQDHYFNKIKRNWIAARNKLYELLERQGDRLTYPKAEEEVGEHISPTAFDKLKKDWIAMKNDQPKHGGNGAAEAPGPRARYQPDASAAPTSDEAPANRIETATVPLPLAPAAAREELPASAVAAMTATVPPATAEAPKEGGKVEMAAVLIEDILTAKSLIDSVGKATAMRLIEVL